MILSKYLNFLLLLVSFNIFSQNNWVTYNANKVNISFDLPSEDVYYSTDDGEGFFSETFYNADEDFELIITQFRGKTYSDNLNFDEELSGIASEFDYKNFSLFFENEIKPGVNSKYAISYDTDYECMVIFGVIHDKISKTIYDIELVCFEISVFDGAIIIESLKI
jgi:hypothetical protein